MHSRLNNTGSFRKNWPCSSLAEDGTCLTCFFFPPAHTNMAQQKHFQTQTRTEVFNALFCYTQPPEMYAHKLLLFVHWQRVTNTTPPKLELLSAFFLNPCSWYRTKCCDEPHEIFPDCASQERRLQCQQKKKTQCQKCGMQRPRQIWLCYRSCIPFVCFICCSVFLQWGWICARPVLSQFAFR